MHADHDPHLAHHFPSRQRQFEAGKLGMWLFLATEILLFGGLFCAYAVYRASHPEIFVWAHRFLDTSLGAFNTAVLIGSSFTMAWAVRAAQLGQQRALERLLAATILLAAVFLAVKGVEYEHKWKEGLLWGKRFRPPAAEVTGAASQAPAVSLASAPSTDERSEIPLAPPGPPGLSEGVAALPPTGGDGPPRNVQIFFGVYFAMTGLHALHVVAGMVLLGVMLVRARRGAFGPSYFTPVDLSGLYWHLVDLIWIYLFPLLYLIH